ncbi:MAG: aldehyde ferredoxin oxidoreductase family protein [Thermoanaerobacteraceae bacterium]|nr:aldehyde ferredoxin oxidoreductase family protein [Thermoanaerobacteraceae bacterium]
MPYGYNGKILRVNLNNGSTMVEDIDETFYRTYMGGSGLISYYLLRELKPRIDALSADNILIFAPGVLTGTLLAGMCRFIVGAKSPLTGAFGQAEAGGWWGPELKRAGFDAIIVEGRAAAPVYIYIKDGEAEIRDASHLWGKKTGEVQDIIRQESNDERTRVVQIGLAGENLVRYACIVNELKHFNGRNGLGAVMGSKNLKAIAVRGNMEIPVKDEDSIKAVRNRFAGLLNTHPLVKQLYSLGTSATVMGNNALGILPTRNFKMGEFEGASKISGETMVDTILEKREGCFACPVRCKRAVKVEEYGVETRYGGPEYETLASFGPLCMVDDLKIIAKANQLCNQYTLDTISTGATIAFAMECFEEGIITKEDTDGIELRFGNGQAVLQMIEKIARREGIGNILAEGSERAAKLIGKGSERFLVTVKGQELAMHDPRGKYAVGLGYAVSERGADHMISTHDTMLASHGISFDTIAPFGIYEPTDPREFSALKVKTFTYLEYWWSFFNMAGICDFVPVPRSAMPASDVIETLRAVTGWDTSLWEVLKAGERAINMARMFDIREGFTAEDDKLPERVHEPIENGLIKGGYISKEEFEKAKRLYYSMMGWDEKGVPTEVKLLELGLDWLN